MFLSETTKKRCGSFKHIKANEHAKTNSFGSFRVSRRFAIALTIICFCTIVLPRNGMSQLRDLNVQQLSSDRDLELDPQQQFDQLPRTSLPNVLIIMADDCTFSDLPVYGGVNAITPNIDLLAQDGIVFDRAYLASAMCQPCRAELYTGLYPLRNGCAWNHSASRPDVESMPQHLSRLGYRVGLAGKVHVKPDEVYPFESVQGFDPNCVREPTREHDVEAVKEFMTRDSTQPFCLVVALVEPHVPWVMGDPTQYPQDEIELPPTLADTPRTREAYSRYLAEITYMDQQVGDLLRVLHESILDEETLVLFTSEQGSQFPGSKWTNWDTGVHTALIARWVGTIDAGRRTDALVQYADILPTIVELATQNLPSVEDGDRVYPKPLEDYPFDGMSFLDVLMGADESPRRFVYGMHNNVPEGPPYPIRSITDGEYHLILNLLPDELYIEKHLMGLQGDGRLNNPYWSSWIGQSTNETIYRLVQRYMHRPAVEFYRLSSDPYELNNLAADPNFDEPKQVLRRALMDWMAEQGDPGIEQDTIQSLNAARRGEHRYPSDHD